MATTVVFNTKIEEVENKIHDVNGLATTAFLYTKIGEVDNKIPDFGVLVKKTDYNAKISDIEKKYFTTSDYNKFTSEILDAKIKLKVATLATRAELKAEQDKIVKLQTHDLSYFLGKTCFDNDDIENMFLYQPTFNTLESTTDKGIDYVIDWKSQVLFESKLLPLTGAFLPNMKYSGYKIGTEFNNTQLVVEQSNYATKTVNAYFVYDLEDWPKIPLRTFKLKNCMLGATNIVKNSFKGKYVYSGYGIAFDGKGSWSFGNDLARNLVIFGVDNSSSSHTYNHKNMFLVLGKEDTFGINGSIGAPEKKFSINFSKSKTQFFLSFNYIGDNSYLFLNGKEIYKFKVDNKKVNFKLSFV